MVITIKELISEVKKKKELSGIDESIVSEALKASLSKLAADIGKLKRQDVKLIIKEVRNELRHYAGRFQRQPASRLSLINEGKISELLKSHASTSERIEFYPEIRKLISGLNISSVLDLGCGINPIAIASPGIEYFASDINSEDLEIVSTFFNASKIKGRVFVCDLRKAEFCAFPKSDLCMIFKVFDVIEKKGHKLAEKIITSVDSKYFLISFSTKTLSGRPMNHPQRGWIERLLGRLGYNFKIIKSKNEIFYLASKN